MAVKFEQIGKKYLSEKRQEVIEWSPDNGSVRKRVIDVDGKVLKEDIWTMGKGKVGYGF